MRNIFRKKSSRLTNADLGVEEPVGTGGIDQFPKNRRTSLDELSGVDTKKRNVRTTIQEYRGRVFVGVLFALWLVVGPLPGYEMNKVRVMVSDCVRSGIGTAVISPEGIGDLNEEEKGFVFRCVKASGSIFPLTHEDSRIEVAIELLRREEEHRVVSLLDR
jgi:hypothetical protein